MGFDALKARRNHLEDFILLAYSLPQSDDQFFGAVCVRHRSLLSLIEECCA
jgi:hypothetical protein